MTIRHIKLGDAVKWQSQAGGFYTEKSGTVVRVISERASHPPIRIAQKEFPNHRIMFDGGGIPGRAKIGYFVSVPPRSKRGKPKLYMPYPSKLSLLHEDPAVR